MWAALVVFTPVLKINNHATGGWRTKDILGGPKAWSPKKKVANVEFYVIFEVFAFCGRRTKADFKEWAFRDRATIDDRSASDLKMSSPISLRTQPGGGSFCMAASSFWMRLVASLDMPGSGGFSAIRSKALQSSLLVLLPSPGSQVTIKVFHKHKTEHEDFSESPTEKLLFRKSSTVL